ncbi:MAG: molybdopterin-synthase adenylyltransferase MoeB [Acidobacteriota bacterium]
MKSFKELLTETKKQIKEVTVDDVAARRAGGNGRVLLDVREGDEYRAGHIEGAKLCPRGFLELRIEDIAPDRETPITLYCAGGTRSALAAKSLVELGYQDVESMAGGFNKWRETGKPVFKPRELTTAQQSRYSRHLSIPEVGIEGQGRLLDAKVLLIGAGGLGSPSAYYLAAAGVGTMGIVDNDVVDESNLQRQILHSTKRVGVPKVESAKETLTALNPDVKVIGVQERLTSGNVERLFKDYDIVVDGCDNFATRYLVNDACVNLRKANVHGSVYRFEGQVTTFVPFEGPCYRCLYPEPPPAELAPSCADAGVLGVLPGVIGLLQAIETIKLILKKGDPLVGRLLMYDALSTSFREMKLKRDRACPMCGDGAKFTGYIDYEAFCAR